ncbi:MAG: tRNA lysidine(34) synthetase TilS, partial [Chitinophagaceae bacterium]|nr:tRNA lysidine(34) synthetase TilS [Chitinophagaceae bacterium]
MSLQKKFSDHFKVKGFPVTEPVLLAVSGGVDSMVMAQMFLTAGSPFGMAHCNFQLRGEESDKDEQLVLDWCVQHNVPVHHVRFDTQAKVDEWKKGIQETARILRYEWLEKVRKENGYAAIATAHHANDNAETLLMNLFKGTGISGLHGIPVTNGRIIRPLLFAAKKDILIYAEEHAVPYRNDASNSSDKYLRNDVRLNILPVVQKAFPNVICNLNNSIQRFTEVEVLYNKAVDAELKKLLELRGKDYYIPVRKMLKVDPLQTICYELFRKFGFATGQINDIIALLNSE